jgi:hypothetical protein
VPNLSVTIRNFHVADSFGRLRHTRSVLKAEGDRRVHEKAGAMAEFVTKKSQQSMETMYSELLQAQEHARSAVGAMRALSDRNNFLEEDNKKLPGLTEAFVSLGNLTRVLMWSEKQEDSAALSKVRPPPRLGVI